MVITLSLQITNHIFTTIINHQAYEKCACPVRTNMFSSSNVCKFCQLKRCQREELWLLSLLWSLSDDGVNPNLLDVPESIFNSFVFNLGFISSIPLYLRGGLGGRSNRSIEESQSLFTAFFWYLHYSPLLVAAATFYYQYQSWNGPLFGQHAIQFVMI